MMPVKTCRLHIYLLSVSPSLDVGKNFAFCEINIKVLLVHAWDDKVDTCTYG